MNISFCKAALFGDASVVGVYGPERLEYLKCRTQLYPTIITPRNINTHLPELGGLEVIFSSWGMFPLTAAQLDALPSLRALFYAAGSVKCFAEPLLERGITVVSAWAANAVPVAEFTLAQILLANKGYWRNVREYECAEHPHPFRGRGNYGANVAVLGAGQVGRRLIESLLPFHLQILVFDPFLSPEAAQRLGVEKVELAEAFARSDVVSNHLADVPQTVGLLNGTLFASMSRNATFINTGRGATVNEAELVRVLQERQDLTALLDVTDPEPCPHESPLRSLRNVQLTSHIGGSIGAEVARLAAVVLEEFDAWQAGLPLRYAVTQQQLEVLA